MAELAYICAYFDWIDAMKRLDDAERGRLFTALLQYGMSGEEPELCGNEMFTFDSLKLSIDVNKRNYAEKCAKLKNNRAKFKDATKSNIMPSSEIPCNGNQMISNDINCHQLSSIDINCREDKDKYNDKDKYKDNDKDKYKDNDKYNDNDNDKDKLPAEVELSQSRESERVFVEEAVADRALSNSGDSVSGTDVSLAGLSSEYPYAEFVVGLYHDICKSFPKVLNISEKRREAIRSCLQAYSLKDFETVFAKAEKSSFLKGANSNNWCASFDWLMDETNFTRILEGLFDDKPPRASPGKPGNTRYVPNPLRDTSGDMETSMAILEAEMERLKMK